MFNRRQFIESIPLASLAVSANKPCQCRNIASRCTGEERTRWPAYHKPSRGAASSKQRIWCKHCSQPACTAWIEYGFEPDKLSLSQWPANMVLVRASDRALHIRVETRSRCQSLAPVYYRVVAQSLTYQNAYALKRGEQTINTYLHAAFAPEQATKIRLACVNDTHENLQTIQSLHQIVEQLQPDLLLWNGDTCNDFDRSDSPQQITLNPAQDLMQAWASNDASVLLRQS